MTSQAAVKIIIPAYNNPTLLRETLQSLKNQKFEQYSVLIIDDNSPEALFPHVQDFLADSRFKFKRNPINLGGMQSVAEVLNSTVERYFMILHHDDVLDEAFLYEIVENGLELDKRVGLASSLFCVKSNEDISEYTEHLIPDYPTGNFDLTWHLLFSNWMLQSFTVYRTTALLDSGAIPRWIRRNANRGGNLLGRVSAGEWYINAIVSRNNLSHFNRSRLGYYIRHDDGRTETNSDLRIEEVSFVLDHIFDDVDVFSLEQRYFAKIVSNGRIFSNKSTWRAFVDFVEYSSYSRSPFKPKWLNTDFIQVVGDQIRHVLNHTIRDSKIGAGQRLISVEEFTFYKCDHQRLLSSI